MEREENGWREGRANEKKDLGRRADGDKAVGATSIGVPSPPRDDGTVWAEAGLSEETRREGHLVGRENGEKKKN